MQVRKYKPKQEPRSASPVVIRKRLVMPQDSLKNVPSKVDTFRPNYEPGGGDVEVNLAVFIFSINSYLKHAVYFILRFSMKKFGKKSDPKWTHSIEAIVAAVVMWKFSMSPMNTELSLALTRNEDLI